MKVADMASIPTSQAITKRSSDSGLMPPPPPPKRIKRPAKVIDEDSYTDALSHIIARDFFPGLIEVESKQDYLDALESQDNEWIASAGRKLTEVMAAGPDGRRHRGRRGTSMTQAGLLGLGGETPRAWQGDTPGSVISSASAATSSDKPDVDTNLSLSAFQAKYTSEDNESFYKLLDKQNLKKSEKYAWMWSGNKIASARQIAHRKREAKRLADKSSQEATDGGKALLQIEPPDTRPAKPDAWPSRPNNPLMFGPNSFEDAAQTIQQTAESTSRAPPKVVVYDNTRLATIAQTPNDPPPSPSLSAVQDALAGRPRPTASETAFPISSPPSTPRVNGYSFVDPDPDPDPDPSPTQDPPIPHPHSTLLGAGDATPNPFNIKDGSRREALHHRMVDKVARGKRQRKREADVKTPVVPRFASSPRVARGGLTPAAQRLLGKVGGKPGGWESRPSLLRDGWTPGK